MDTIFNMAAMGRLSVLASQHNYYFLVVSKLGLLEQPVA